MTHHLAANWMVHSLGWALLHFCWQGAVAAALLWSALQLLADHSARARYGATCCALALIVAMPLATFAHIATTEYHLANVSHDAGYVFAPALVVPGADAPWLVRLTAALDPALPRLLLAWLAGSGLFLMRLSVGFHVTRRLRTLHVAAPAEELQRIFTTLHRRLRLSRPVVLMNSALVQVPTVIGWLRPVVLLPVSCFTGLPQAQIEAILSHELAHIRRHDYLVSVVQSVVEALLFYHPAVWWVSRQMRRERECCCDDMAVAIGGDALAYARALTTLETQRSLYPQVMLGANGGVLTMRIKRLLMPQSSSAASQFAAVAMLAVLAVSAVSIGSTARAETRSAPAIAPLVLHAQPAPIVSASKPVTPRVKKAIALPAPASTSAADAVAALTVQEPQTQNQPPVRIASGVQAQAIVLKTQPVYPELARAGRIQGAVTLHAIISATGEVVNLQVIDGPEALRASALDAVQHWVYKPYLLNGVPVEVETTITVHYNIGQ